MHTQPPLRQLRRRLTQWLGMNALALLALAALPVLLSIDLYTGHWLASMHVQPKLHEYCRSHICALDPALVSTSYALQGAYSLAWALFGGMAVLRSSNLGSFKTKAKAVGAIVLCAIIFVFDDATGVDRGGIYSNYVHSNSAYLFRPTFMHLFVTTIVIASCWYDRNFEALAAARGHANQGA